MIRKTAILIAALLFLISLGGMLAAVVQHGAWWLALAFASGSVLASHGAIQFNLIRRG